MTKDEIVNLLRRSEEQISKALAIPLTEDEKVRMDRYLCVKRKGCIEMAKKHYTKDFINEVVNTYVTTDLTVKEICEGYGIATSTLNLWVQKNGATHKRRTQVGNNDNKACSNCKQVVKVEDAKYCPFCGAQLKSEKELMVERLKNVAGFVQYIPKENQDEFLSVVEKAVTMLLEEK